jgi:hypothetical protein
MRRLILAAAVAVIALAMWAVYGSGSVGYDQAYTLLWGDDLAEGRLPGYEAPRAPTPHPLPNLVGMLLSPLGDGSLEALKALSLISFAALAVAAYALGKRLFSPAVGVLFALLVVTRPSLVNQALIASIDVPFLALVLGAAAIEVRRPRAGMPVLVLLGIAGLLRPEAWLLTGIYTLLLLRDAERRDQVRYVVAAALPPLLWVASDVAITGDPFWSFNQARATSERLAAAERYGDGGPIDTIEWAARSWKGLLHLIPAIAAVVGLAIVAWLWRARVRIPLALLALGTLSFLVIGFAGLPLLTRYFFMPATMLCLVIAAATLGWRELPDGSRERSVARAAGLVLAAALLVHVPLLVDHLDGALEKTDRAQRLQNDLRRVAEEPRVRELMPRCQPVQTRLFRARPTLLWELRDDPPTRIVATRGLGLTEGMLLVYAFEENPLRPSGFEQVAANRTWTVLARCPSVKRAKK